MVNFGYLSNDKLVIFNDDKDNDEIMDVIDAFDTDSEEWADFDFDGIGTNQDLDDDNDGILQKHARSYCILCNV